VRSPHSLSSAPSLHLFFRSPQDGFTYLGLIILVTVIGMVGAATLKIGALMQRAHAEEKLLEIGAAFSDALKSYAATTPKGLPLQPPSLQELLRDSRTPALRRHLRKIFVDPVTGGTEWGIAYLADKAGVVGVYSLSQATPLKIGNFDVRFISFEGKQHLSDWIFTAGAIAPVLPVASVAPPSIAPQHAADVEPAAQPTPVEPAPQPTPADAAGPLPETALPPPQEAAPPRLENPSAEPEDKANDNTAPQAESKPAS
jgi:type II secretory pathway pseudopilin PulG